MAEYYDYLTNRGVIVPDTSTVLTDVQNEFKALLGGDLDVSPETPQGRLIELIARCRVFVVQTAAASSNVFNLNKANGFGLDDLGSLFLLSRNPATYTTTTVELSGVNGTIVPEGTRLQTTGGDIFVLTENYTIGSEFDATFRAEKKGVVPCPVGTLTIILDAVNGLESAVNHGNPSLGTELESDSEFRQRIRNSLNVNSIAVLSAIKANLEELDGVSGTYLYDNYSDSAVTVDDITVPAHSILAVVDGGEDSEIAKVLYDKKTVGTGYCGTSADPNIEIVEEDVVDPNYGTIYKVRFARPSKTNIIVDIMVDRKDYTGSDLKVDIKQAILDWSEGKNDEVDGIKIGTPISPFEISAAVSNTIPEIFIRDVKIAKEGGTPSAEIISMDEAEKGVVLSSNITVTVLPEDE